MKRVVVIVVAVIAVVGLVVWLGPRALRDRRLSAAEGRWTASAINAYRWRIDTGCFGPCTNGRPLTITVRDGRVTDVSRDPTGISTTPTTVEELFARIEHLKGSDHFSVTYDARLGYPVRGSFDPMRNATDDEWGFEVKSFIRLD